MNTTVVIFLNDKPIEFKNIELDLNEISLHQYATWKLLKFKAVNRKSLHVDPDKKELHYFINDEPETIAKGLISHFP